MTEQHEFDLRPLLDYIDLTALSYQDWVSVGMALQLEGYDLEDWENWSRRDAGRFHEGECARKWAGFRGSASPVTGATITQMAKEGGWTPAALKYRRVLSGANPTPVEHDQAIINLYEELGDVLACLFAADLIQLTDQECIDFVSAFKLERWVRRLELVYGDQ